MIHAFRQKFAEPGVWKRNGTIPHDQIVTLPWLLYNAKRRADPGNGARFKRMMTDATILWDLDDDPEGNVQHIAEHDLTKEDVEDVLLNPDNSDTTSDSSGRPIVFGDTETGRHIAVVYEIALEDPLMIRVVTAYDVPER